MPRKSKAGYPAEWENIAQAVKQRAGWKCVRCGHAHAPQLGRCLTVHHLDMDPSNNRWWNTAALCQACHLSIQGRVAMEQEWLLEHSEWFKPYVAGRDAFRAGKPDDEETIRARLSAKEAGA